MFSLLTEDNLAIGYLVSLEGQGTKILSRTGHILLTENKKLYFPGVEKEFVIAYHGFAQPHTEEKSTSNLFPHLEHFFVCPSHRRELVPLSKPICIKSNCWECISCIFF